jgi:hypothetical protein
MIVRYWLAARLEDKLRNPRQAKNVPRVECPENPAQRRESIATVFPDTILCDSTVAVDVATQESVGAAEEATRSQSPRELPPPRTSTRRRKPSARAIDIEMSRNPVNVAVTRFQTSSQTGQRKHTRRRTTRVFSLSHPNPQVAGSQFSNQRSNGVKSNTIVPWVEPMAPPSLKRRRGVIYVKPSRTALNTRKSKNHYPHPHPA